MAVNPPNKPLKIIMVEKNLKNRDLAQVLDITPGLFSQKINHNGSTFNIREMSKLCDYLNVSMDIFRVENVLKTGRGE
ncbi:MAG TPA: helix-turn-helix transcriptional regulator [Candidatus Nosocomiicoccus stercorigallinarum]|nr:helix-turn-helix transcriptional regulator [Candidatus Nosocomiicoccus stercorigallinarum]